MCDDSSNSFDSMIYREIIGSFMYMRNTRPNICFAVSKKIQFPMDLRHVHLVSTKNILRYLKGIVYYGKIIRLTYTVMLIQIGKVAPLTGRTLHIATLVCDPT